MHSLTFQGFWGVGDEAGDRKGYEALVASSNPRHGDKVIYFPAACPKPGRWNGWNWRGTANGKAPLLSRNASDRAQRAAQQDQGQRSGAPAASLGGIRRCGYTRDPWPDPAAGESPFSLGQVLPGHSPDIDADAAVWGRPRRKAAGTQCLAMVQQWVNHFLAGMAIPARKSNAAAGPSCYKGRDIPPTHWPDSWHPANAHPTPALVRTIAKS